MGMMKPERLSVTATWSSGPRVSMTASAAPVVTIGSRLPTSVVSSISTTATRGFSLRGGRSMRTGSARSRPVFCQPPGP